MTCHLVRSHMRMRHLTIEVIESHVEAYSLYRFAEVRYGSYYADSDKISLNTNSLNRTRSGKYLAAN